MFDWKSSSPGELTWIFFSHVRSMYNKTLRCQNTWTSWENQMKWKVVKVSTTSDPIVFWSNYSSRKALQRNQNKRAVSLIKMEDAPAVSVSAGFWPRRQLLTAILSVFFLSLSSTILVIHSTLFYFLIHNQTFIWKQQCIILKFFGNLFWHFSCLGPSNTQIVIKAHPFILWP